MLMTTREHRKHRRHYEPNGLDTWNVDIFQTLLLATRTWHNESTNGIAMVDWMKAKHAPNT